ncbi:hypothetical protein IQ266_00200 [filamentous cyanobacterium LEGE 11480]|uniref:Uncharacterized protein n=1 Tax=Romeriopsis navalis LEGE 11480 TaxID=2777977 RepID=A0A928Z161_9CYAN|nr:hypothetical protein [Romeriopsis navalis]MBE9028174.1 hypothetical protein [Romeriopsis navalis LEGE 11480]
MKTLDQQIKNLIKDAPNDPEMRQITETFAPVLKEIASKFRYLEYYVLQTPDQAWVSFTLNHRTQSHVEKTIIYAFPSLEDVSRSIAPQDLSALSVVSIGIIDLLFQFYALNLGEGLVLFDTPGNTEKAIEIPRTEFDVLLRQSMDPLPPNIA